MTTPTRTRRSTTNRMLAGVCGGLAEYTGTDPLLWRIGFIALALAGPGVFVYLLLWILMPEGPAGPGEASRPLDGIMDRLRYGNAGAPSSAPPAGTPYSAPSPGTPYPPASPDAPAPGPTEPPSSAAS